MAGRLVESGHDLPRLSNGMRGVLVIIKPDLGIDDCEKFTFHHRTGQLVEPTRVGQGLPHRVEIPSVPTRPSPGIDLSKSTSTAPARPPSPLKKKSCQLLDVGHRFHTVMEITNTERNILSIWAAVRR